MKLERIQIGKHRRLNSASIKFIDLNDRFVGSSVYGRSVFTVFAGPNGGGKTSLLSFLAQLFHNLERFPERVPGAFRVEYSRSIAPKRRVRCAVYRHTGKGPINLQVEGLFDKTLTRETSDLEGCIAYEDARRYLPEKIIVSAFSFQGEYPPRRPRNYVGDQRVFMYDVGQIYGRNHFSFPSLSTAIARLCEQIRAYSEPVKAIEGLLAAKFTQRVRVRSRHNYAYEDDWVDVDKSILDQEAAGDIYINDVELLQSNGEQLTLMTMSSGQKMLLLRILSILGEIENDSLVILEEPELHLDPSWCRQLISLLVLLFRPYRSHILIATHSFALLNSVPHEWLVLVREGAFQPAPRSLFLANESAVAFALFHPDRNAVETSVRKAMAGASMEELRALAARVGESPLRYDVLKLVEGKANPAEGR